MFDWSAFTLFLYILARMSGFVLFNPILSRTGFPAIFRAGVILVLSISVYAAEGGAAAVPYTTLELIVRLLLEMGLGLLVAFLMRFFFYIAEQAGDVVDVQMGMSMARTYDAGSQTSLTVTANLLNALMMLLFFAANGHVTMLRLMLTSGEIVPYGAARLTGEAASRMVELFAGCALLAVKLSLPILAAELLGQVGMGVLMKVIPQINVFAINIELKVIIGLVMLLLLITPMSEFLLEAEGEMFSGLQEVLSLTG